MVEISTDPARLDVDLVHRFLSEEAYWAIGRPRALTERAIAHSLSFGAYADDGGQVAFARVVTDHALFAYLADVFVLPAVRGRGVGKQLVGAIMAHEAVRAVRRVLLATDDAHGLRAVRLHAARRRRGLDGHPPDALTLSRRAARAPGRAGR